MSKKNTKKTATMKKGPLEWIYIMEADLTMKDIYGRLRNETDFDVEYWEEAEAMEISFPEAGSMDFEQSQDEDVLWVTLSAKSYDASMEAMKTITKVCGGQFSVDE
ncbi:MAG: hypothetical protein Q4E53_00090 [Eubacteriales bacterium]|nr:hypothetical protein [Eubacteriales bacterium]